MHRLITEGKKLTLGDAEYSLYLVPENKYINR